MFMPSEKEWTQILGCLGIIALSLLISAFALGAILF